MIHWLMAFVWAVEPWALSLPLEQAGPLALALLLADDEPVSPDLLLSELEHAASAIALARSPAMTPTRCSFTRFPLRLTRRCPVERDAKRGRWRDGVARVNVR